MHRWHWWQVYRYLFWYAFLRCHLFHQRILSGLRLLPLLRFFTNRKQVTIYVTPARLRWLDAQCPKEIIIHFRRKTKTNFQIFNESVIRYRTVCLCVRVHSRYFMSKKKKRKKRMCVYLWTREEVESRKTISSLRRYNILEIVSTSLPRTTKFLTRTEYLYCVYVN